MNPARNKADWRKFEWLTEKLMREHHVAGAAVAVSQDGQLVYAKGFGYRDVDNRLPVTPKTIFGIASVSKSFTALAIMQLQDEGMLSVDDPVVKHLPEWKIQGMEDMEAIKIRHLLSHTTGIPPLKRTQDIVRFSEHLPRFEAEEYELLGRPGEYLSYSNDSFLLLGEIIQRISGKLYRRHMTARILEPLDMNRSTYSIEEILRFDDVTVPYVYDDKVASFQEVQWPQLGTYEVGGGVRSNVLDLMKYGQVFVNQGVVNGHKIVSPEGIHMMYKPVYEIAPNRYYALALEVTMDYSGVTLVEHGGGQPGVSSNFGFVPERNLVVAVLTNVSGVPAENIWLAATNTALGLSLERRRERLSACEMASCDLQKFSGTYQSGEGFDSSKLTVYVDDGQARLKIAGKEYRLQAVSRDSFVFEENGRRQVVKFHFDETGKPWAVFFNLRMLRRVS